MLPWVLSRLVSAGRVLEIGYAFAEPAYLAGLLRSGVELVGVDLAERDVEGMERIVADVRALPLPDESVDQGCSSRPSSTSARTTPATA